MNLINCVGVRYHLTKASYTPGGKMASMEKYLKLKFDRKAIIYHRLEMLVVFFSDIKHSMPMA